MDAPFPFGLPLPTAVYLVLYLSTLMIHIAFMNYVLAGSATMAAALVFRRKAAFGGPLFEMLRDWMPFMLSAAITAGIAPLLFLQVLYKEQFYTANVLLFYRWMAILPALIAGFYLGYLFKKSSAKWPLWALLLVGCGVFGAFAFVGWSWVENHLLSVETAEQWREQYASGAHRYASPELLPRLLLWFIAAFPTMALMAGWQLWDKLRGKDDGARAISILALGGIAVSSLWASRYYLLLTGPARAAIAGTLGRPYAILSIAGGAIELVAWVMVFRERRFSLRWLGVGTAGLVANFIGTAVMNESIRLVALDGTVGLPVLYARHAASWQVAGMPVFLVFFAINAGLMAFCVWRVRHGHPRQAIEVR